MKIIDDKGRLFGAINIIDLSILLFLLCFIPMFIAGYEIMTPKPAAPPAEKKIIYADTRIDVRVANIDPHVIDLMKAGDSENDSTGQSVAKLLSFVPVKPAEMTVTLDGKELKVTGGPEEKSAQAVFVVRCIPQDNHLYYNGYVLRIGQGFTFNSDTYTVSGIITGIRIIE